MKRIILLSLLVAGCAAPKPGHGKNGQNAQPCTVSDTTTGLLVTCSGTALELYDGHDGATGPQGEPGHSIVGPQGPQGEPGQSIVGPQGPPGPVTIKCFKVNKKKFVEIECPD